MEPKEFRQFRNILGKLQKQMGELLGVSLKAIQSYEQGWRDIPFHVERQILFLMVQKHAQNGGRVPKCWEDKNCPKDRREKCPTWEFKTPNLCWLINGTACDGEIQKNWQDKMKRCRQCKVLRDQLPPFED